jgi:hypothetical protein
MGWTEPPSGDQPHFKHHPEIDIEILAKELHEAGREAVVKGATVAADHHGEKTRTFLEWDEITENAREGRRIQARYLLDKFVIIPKEK